VTARALSTSRNQPQSISNGVVLPPPASARRTVREFAKKNPSHAYIEIDVEAEDAGEQLAAATGRDGSCWGQEVPQ